MKTYVKPSLKFKPDLWILHTGTNDLRSEAKPAEIADNIIQLAVTLKSEENEVAVSSIVERGDKFNGKGIEVNSILKLKSTQFNIAFIEHKEIKQNLHLNGSALHLNPDGVNVLNRNFIQHINL